MDANHYYYTFSTIAQTLAAAFAVLAAFVILRTQWADGQVQIFSRFIAELPDMTPERHTQWLDRLLTGAPANSADCISWMRHESDRNLSGKRFPWAEFGARKIAFVSARRKEVFWWLKLSMIATLITIVWAVAFIPMTPYLVGNWLGAAVLALCVTFFLACVAAYSVSVFKAFERSAMPDGWGVPPEPPREAAASAA